MIQLTIGIQPREEEGIHCIWQDPQTFFGGKEATRFATDINDKHLSFDEKIQTLKQSLLTAGLQVSELNTIFLKWGILNVPFCSIFVPFHFYLIMTLVVPCLHNMFMVLLIFAL